MTNIKKLLTIILILLHSATFAAIPCRPGLGNCPDEPGDGIPRGPGNYSTVAIGYYEIPSPDCGQDDKEFAIQKAKNKALSDAKKILESDDIVRTSQFRIYQECKRGIYATSSKGLSWIVQAFAEYSRK